MEKQEEFKVKIKKMANEKPKLKVIKIAATDNSNRLNEPLIEMFDKLASILQKQGEPFKARAYQKAQETIMLSKEDITKNNFLTVLKGKPGIGEAIIKKIQEFAETGNLRLLEKEKENPINILTDVYGIGPKKAKDLVAEGITTIAQLNAKKDKVLNSVQKTGLQYYEDILERIPRSEIDEYKAVFDKTFVKKGAHDKFEIVGSYRRGAKASGDIDVIVTSDTGKTFEKFIDDLVKQKIILEILSRGKSKCLVITRLNGSAKARRVDFLYTTPKEYPFSVLYFTGSKTFNTVMRARALTMGYSLNEHGLSHMSKKTVSIKDRKGKLVDHVFPDERSIFKFLHMEYKTPEERVDGRGVSGAVNLALSETKSEVLNLAESEAVNETKNSVLSEVVNLEKPPIEIGQTLSKDEALGDKVIKIRRKKEKGVTEKLKEELPAAKRKTMRKKETKTKITLEAIPESDSEKKGSKEKVKKGTKKLKEKEIKVKRETKKRVMPKDVDASIQHFKTNGISVLESLKEKELEKMIVRTNDAYYNGEAPLLTDNEYDILKEFVEKKFPKNAVIKEVGAPVEKNKVTLPYHMASMDKIKPDTGALNSWKAKYKGPYVTSCKLDGVSGMYSTEQKDAKLYTRGNGKIGQDITHLIKHMNFPNIPGIVVRGEFIIPKATFNSKYKEQFANPRNLVSGIVNRQTMDTKIKDLHFVAYEVIKPELKPSEQMAFLQKNGFETVMNKSLSEITNDILSETLMKLRKDYEYEIDGIIVANDAVYPRTDKNPAHAFAFKMVLSDQVAEAKVVDVIWNASKDGYLKPRVRIEPIRLAGVTIEYATGFNAAFIETNKIGIGAIIKIIRSGDVIPHIQEVITPAEKAKMPDVKYTWNSTHVDIVLENKSEDSTVLQKNVTGFFKGIEVDGLSGGNITKIINGGFETVPKIVKMTKEDFLTIEGFKEKMAVKLSEGIRVKLEQATLLTIMSASNIFGRGFSDKKIEIILNELGPTILTSNDSDEKKVKAIEGLKGMSTKTAESFIQNIPEFLEFLEECGLESKLNAVKKMKTPDKTHELFGKSVVLSGTRDKELEKRLKEVGAVLGSSVSKNTFAVITPDLESDTGKVAKAKELNILVITPEEFIRKYI
jgi:NAD-dependent DNA ligase